MERSIFETGLYYLTSIMALVVLYLLARMLFIMKKVDSNLLRARVFLNAQFLIRSIKLGAFACVALILHTWAMYLDVPLWDAALLVFAMFCIIALAYDWHKMLRASPHAQ